MNFIRGKLKLLIWLQGIGSFAVWLAGGILLFKRYGKSSFLDNVPRWLSPVCMLFGGVVMMLGVVLVSSWGGMRGGILTVYGWIGVTIFGAIFVGLQTLGAMIAARQISPIETPKDDQSSNRSGKL